LDIIKLSILISSLFATATFAQNCPHGSLSPQFCDRNGDMMADADAPKDPKKWLDPYTLVLGTVPSQSFMFDPKAKKALIEHIEKITGKQVEFFTYQTNSAELEAMRSGILHIAGMNTGSVPTAINCAGFHLFAMTARKGGGFGYTMQIITYPGSGIKEMSDIKNHTLLFTSSSSNSGHKAPVALLKKFYGLKEGIDYKSKYSGSHTSSILKVANHKYKLAAVASGYVNAMMKDNKIPKGGIIKLFQSATFPTTGYGYNYRLKPQLAKKIVKAFLSFRYKEGNTTKPFDKFNETQFIPANYNRNWRIIRDIDEANNISYNCR